MIKQPAVFFLLSQFLAIAYITDILRVIRSVCLGGIQGKQSGYAGSNTKEGEVRVDFMLPTESTEKVPRLGRSSCWSHILNRRQPRTARWLTELLELLRRGRSIVAEPLHTVSFASAL